MKVGQWTKEEDEYLKNNYKKMSDEELATALNRSRTAISQRRTRLKLLKNTRRAWTREEDDFIRDNLDLTDEEIGQKINRTERGVRNRRTRTLKLKRGKGTQRAKKLNEKALVNLLKEKESVVRKVIDLQMQRGRHFAYCDCDVCEELRKIERKLVKINTKIRRARGVPSGGVADVQANREEDSRQDKPSAQLPDKERAGSVGERQSSVDR